MLPVGLVCSVRRVPRESAQGAQFLKAHGLAGACESDHLIHQQHMFISGPNDLIQKGIACLTQGSTLLFCREEREASYAVYAAGLLDRGTP
jgi:hypothetical protein